MGRMYPTAARGADTNKTLHSVFVEQGEWGRDEQMNSAEGETDPEWMAHEDKQGLSE